jgi:hypothetical protein
MALSTDIYTILRANSSILSGIGTRIYPVAAPEKATLPCIVYTLTSLNTNESKSYAHTWDDCYVTVTAIATTMASAETYGNLIRTAMNRYKATISSDKIHGCTLTSQDWELIPDFSYQGASTGIAVFAVNTQFKVMCSQNITE